MVDGEKFRSQSITLKLHVDTAIFLGDKSSVVRLAAALLYLLTNHA
jgi:hypothetical protein